MKFLKKYYKEIFAGGLFLLGIVPLIFGKTQFLQFGLFCLCWALGVLVLAYIIKLRGVEQIKTFDKEAKKILKDIQIRGESSVYFGLTNINIMKKERNKLIKKLQKPITVCYIMATIFIITCILCAI